ncbi:hypothetical protein Metho_2656 (plasmid) [Methanomethylovorans hollandica DSM 15978]|jgi:hypothetical protein|uniref:Uncharacterized protein n=1 Tax=Methanomethylovorans hollandica (strain DSM 15978 / NBRC 107637 / DMS1) TaxID=867904 RepID=L0L0C8_METHD|nr:hypothetical protein [Methanomethylovorans hollandica]AGB50786.1 hypothetical protein Metho_2656 [Methanomethylovorans hollandica DSM 15978]
MQQLVLDFFESGDQTNVFPQTVDMPLVPENNISTDIKMIIGNPINNENSLTAESTTVTETNDSEDISNEVPETPTIQDEDPVPENNAPSKRKNAIDSIKANHELIDGKTNDEAIQAIIERLDTMKEIKDTRNMGIVSVPAGLLLSYSISGSTFGTIRENENDFVERITIALPKEIRGLPGRLRNAIDRELDKLGVKIFANIRFIPEHNLVAVMKVFENVKEEGIGRDNKYSVKNVIDTIWEHKDKINSNAARLGISKFQPINNYDSLQNKIEILTFFIDTSLGESKLSPEIVDQVIQTKTEQIVSQLNENLKAQLEKIVSSLSNTVKKSHDKDGKINGKSINAIKREIENIRSLHQNRTPEIDALLDASEGLLMRSLLEQPKQTVRTTKSKKSIPSKRSSPKTTDKMDIKTQEKKEDLSLGDAILDCL